MVRKNPLINDHYYHVFTRSIAKYVIFRSPADYERMIAACRFYRDADSNEKFSQPSPSPRPRAAKRPLVDIVAFCLMPTHLHLILQQRTDQGITDFMRRILNSYSHYFNIKYDRRGPLWEGRFKNKIIQDDEYMVTATFYIHANPLKAMLVKNARDWSYSSLPEYLNMTQIRPAVTQFRDHLKAIPIEYERFLLKSFMEDFSRIKGEGEPFDY